VEGTVREVELAFRFPLTFVRKSVLFTCLHLHEKHSAYDFLQTFNYSEIGVNIYIFIICNSINIANLFLLEDQPLAAFIAVKLFLFLSESLNSNTNEKETDFRQYSYAFGAMWRSHFQLRPGWCRHGYTGCFGDVAGRKYQ